MFTKIIIYFLEVIAMSPLKMGPLEQAFWLIIITIGTVLTYFGWAFIGIVGKIMEWFA